MGVTKSTVCTRQRSSETRVTAASSRVSISRANSGELRGRASSTACRSHGPSLAAQPLLAAHCVRRIFSVIGQAYRTCGAASGARRRPDARRRAGAAGPAGSHAAAGSDAAALQPRRERLQPLGEGDAPEAEAHVGVAIVEHGGWEEHHAGLLDEAPAESERAFGCAEACETDAAGARPDEAQEARPLRRKGLELVEVLRDGPQVARHDPLALAQADERQDLAGRARADRRVVLVGREPRGELAVARRQPADAQAGQRVRLGHPRQGHRLVVSLRSRRQPRRRVPLQPPVHLVGEHVGSRLRGDVEQLLALGGGREVARRVVGEVGDDQPRARAQLAAREGGIEAPTLLLVGLPVGDLAAQRLGDTVERLIAGVRRDHVIATHHGYQTLYGIAEALGCEVTYWEPDEEQGWRFDPAFVRRELRPSTRLIVANFPHNPTGYLPTAAECQELLDIAAEAGAYVFSDEMYRGLERDPATRLPSAAERYDKAVALSGMSKTYSLPGLRVGWLATRDRDLSARLAAYKDYTTICASAPGEILALIGLRERERIVARNLRTITENFDKLEAFAAQRPGLLSLVRPRAGSICFARLGAAEGALAFCRRLVEEAGVVLLPSTVFDYGDAHVRFGLGRVAFAEGLEAFAAWLERRSRIR